MASLLARLKDLFSRVARGRQKAMSATTDQSSSVPNQSGQITIRCEEPLKVQVEGYVTTKMDGNPPPNNPSEESGARTNKDPKWIVALSLFLFLLASLFIWIPFCWQMAPQKFVEALQKSQQQSAQTITQGQQALATGAKPLQNQQLQEHIVSTSGLVFIASVVTTGVIAIGLGIVATLFLIRYMED